MIFNKLWIGKGGEAQLHVLSLIVLFNLGGTNFYDFMHNATQYATETGQQRWYYTIIDIDSLGSDVTKGPPATTTQGSNE